MKGGQLYKRSFQGKAMKCLDLNEIEEVLREIHAGDCGSHLGGRRLLEQLVLWNLSDAAKHVKDLES